MTIKDFLKYYPENKRISISEAGLSKRKGRIYKGKASKIPEWILPYEIKSIEAGMRTIVVVGDITITAEE